MLVPFSSIRLLLKVWQWWNHLITHIYSGFVQTWLHDKFRPSNWPSLRWRACQWRVQTAVVLPPFRRCSAQGQFHHSIQNMLPIGVQSRNWKSDKDCSTLVCGHSALKLSNKKQKFKNELFSNNIAKKNKMELTKPIANMYSKTNTLVGDTLVGHSCRTHSFRKPLWDTLAEPSCRTPLWDTLVGQSCGTLL